MYVLQQTCLQPCVSTFPVNIVTAVFRSICLLLTRASVLRTEQMLTVLALLAAGCCGAATARSSP